MKIELKSKIFDEIYELDKDGLPIFKNFVAGKWIKTDSVIEVKSPINLETVAKLCVLNKEQTLEAIEKTDVDKIRNYPGEKRLNSFSKCIELINENFEDFVKSLVIDAGKPYSNAEGEVKATIERFEKSFIEAGFLIGDYLPGDWSEETLESEAIIKREPFGLILAISPFNYPLFISATKIIPALLSGNGFILKPSTLTPIAPLLLTRILELSNIPKESFSTIFPDREALNLLVSHRKIEVISFTGSTETAIQIMKNCGIKTLHFELGGKDPAIVLNDCEIDLAVDKIIKGIVSFSGQRCDAIRLIFVERGIYETFKEKFLREISSYEPKNILEDKKAVMGPLIDLNNANKVEEIYLDAIKNGARELTKFKRDRNYVWPVVLEIDKEKVVDLKLFNEDVFGPITCLIKVENEDEAVEIYNKCRFGLDACVFSKDLSKIRKVARKLKVGAVFANEYPRHGIGYYPFGGMRDSGIGREGIGYSLNTFTTTKSIIFSLKGKKVWEYI